MNVNHYRKQLFGAPQPLPVGDVVLRHFRVPDDVAAWLELRQRAFAAEKPPIRTWTTADFRQEMVAKRWWRDERTWLAVDRDVLDNQVVGSVTMAMRGSPDAAMPVVHWLMVDPQWRRQGVGRVLLACLELEVWKLGFREVQLETHAGWQSAVAMYEKTGYRRLDSPRG